MIFSLLKYRVDNKLYKVELWRYKFNTERSNFVPGRIISNYFNKRVGTKIYNIGTDIQTTFLNMHQYLRPGRFWSVASPWSSIEPYKLSKFYFFVALCRHVNVRTCFCYGLREQMVKFYIGHATLRILYRTRHSTNSISDTPLYKF